MQIVLRLLCLASLTAGGVKAKNLESIKREILQVCLVHFVANVNFTDALNHSDLWLRTSAATTLFSCSFTWHITPESSSLVHVFIRRCTQVPICISSEVAPPAYRR
jgi:hypothetical protein